MYEVRWAHPAVTDLQIKVRTPAVRHYLFAVAQSALDRHPGAWGGRLDNDLWWRRGVTPQDESDPEAIRGGAADGGYEMPYDFVLVYQRPIVTQRPRYFLVLGVLTNLELAAGLGSASFGDGRVAQWVTPARPRPRRVTRPRGGGVGDRR
jgi:hypothetical protein